MTCVSSAVREKRRWNHIERRTKQRLRRQYTVVCEDTDVISANKKCQSLYQLLTLNRSTGRTGTDSGVAAKRTTESAHDMTTLDKLQLAVLAAKIKGDTKHVLNRGNYMFQCPLKVVRKAIEPR
uniref:Uncharacterized protein n=1 Tax=Peronospora matthiolae TaxID=2874970 RepID=A0AAV1VH69_9STRA